ncbi:MAG TPA: hypothetical protein VJN89_02765 [Candidatus Acidoferrum sp.]|nr:hypothetical protein [Candidatus Acidoferrum sp.]
MEEQLDRVERLLALSLLHGMKGMSQQEKAHQLSVAGFSNVEIADLLDTSAQTVAQHLYARKKSKGKKKH